MHVGVGAVKRPTDELELRGTDRSWRISLTKRGEMGRLHLMSSIEPQLRVRLHLAVAGGFVVVEVLVKQGALGW
jgi:hypothetical protein